MHREDRFVLLQARRWAGQGWGFHLATVVRTWGSAPRAPGAWMALRADGRVIGSVSGGCIEADLIDRLTGSEANELPACRLLSYGVDREEASRFRLPCGGQLDILIERAPSVALLDQMHARLEARQRFAREVDLQSGAVILADAAPDDRVEFDGHRFRAVYGPAFRLLLIGAGSLSQRVAELALALDYQVFVCDPRQEYMDEWPIAGVRRLDDMPDDAVVTLAPDAHTAVLALTHDPKLDDMALIEALKSQACYVGALGSRLNGARKRQRMLLFDVTEEQAARLHCPVGLDLGARAPEEIALAILAELTAVRNADTIARHARNER
jgi:xanthine dehydrogenase accessory factor